MFLDNRNNYALKFILLLYISSYVDLRQTHSSVYKNIDHFFQEIESEILRNQSKDNSYQLDVNIASSSLSSKKRPPSLSILMNFGHDGTSSLHLLDFESAIFWADTGNCKHGEMYDPINGICRDIFCIEGYILGNNGCTIDSNSTINSSQISYSSPEMVVEFNTLNELCITGEINSYSVKNKNPCDRPRLSESDNFLSDIQSELTKRLRINYNRIQDLKLISSDFIKNELFNHEISFINEISPNAHLNLKSYKIIERNILSLTLKDKELFNEHVDSLDVYFEMTAMAMMRYSFKVFESINLGPVRLSNVREIIDPGYVGWCGEEKANKTIYFQGEFRILTIIGEDSGYFIYVNETGVIYGTGFFYLTLLYQPKFHYSSSIKSMVQDDDIYNLNNYYPVNNFSNPFESNRFKPWLVDYDLLNFTDVTDLIIDSEQEAIEVSGVVAVCNRAPKIRVNCPSYQTIRISICELSYHPQNRSYCLDLVHTCFTIDQYEYDNLEPDKFIRVCKVIKETINNEVINRKIENLKNSFDSNSSIIYDIAGWMSFVTTIISLICMLMSLITYFLFKELRNIPGWNVINLILALTLAQLSFTLGSLFNQKDFICFLISINTHYGYLASFFWMNIIAIDFYRNFRMKSSHVLLNSITVRDRLLGYALFAWMIPMLIVISALIVDLTVSENYSYRPCYADYLDGCVIISEAPLGIDIKSSSKKDITESEISLETSDILIQDSCDGFQKPNSPIRYFLDKACWISNGKANLIFFGLPIGIIIILNGVFYFLSIYNIRKRKNDQRQNNLRRFSKAKLPADQDIKFYIQMAVIMGFNWIIGFLITTSSNNKNNDIWDHLLIFTFILSNSSTGVFIFFTFICRPEVKNLYKNLLKSKIKKLKSLFGKKKSFSKKTIQRSKTDSPVKGKKDCRLKMSRSLGDAPIVTSSSSITNIFRKQSDDIADIFSNLSLDSNSQTVYS